MAGMGKTVGFALYSGRIGGAMGSAGNAMFKKLKELREGPSNKAAKGDKGGPAKKKKGIPADALPHYSGSKNSSIRAKGKY